jgi:hypothetical protein
MFIDCQCVLDITAKHPGHCCPRLVCNLAQFLEYI